MAGGHICRAEAFMPTAVGLQHWAFGRFLTGWPLRAIAVLTFAAAMLVATGPGHLPVAEAAGQPPLLPAAGQFVSVTPAYVLNTVTGLGESSAQPLAAG